MNKLELFGIIMLWIGTVLAFYRMRDIVRHNKILMSDDLLGAMVRATGKQPINPLPWTLAFIVGTVSLIVYYI